MRIIYALFLQILLLIPVALPAAHGLPPETAPLGILSGQNLTGQLLLSWENLSHSSPNWVIFQEGILSNGLVIAREQGRHVFLVKTGPDNAFSQKNPSFFEYLGPVQGVLLFNASRNSPPACNNAKGAIFSNPIGILRISGGFQAGAILLPNGMASQLPTSLSLNAPSASLRFRVICGSFPVF